MTIRRATPDDGGSVADVFIAARKEMLSYLPDLHDEADIRRFVAGVVKASEVWLAEDEQGVAGFAALQEDLLGHLYVHPSVQGQGIGTALLDHAKQLRPKGIRLYVFQQNEGARRLYERNGFGVLELGDGSGNEERVPDALYGWPGET